MRQFGWYVFQGAIVIGWLVFSLEVLNKTPSLEPPIAPHVALIMGVLFAAIATGLVNGLMALFAWLRKPKRLRGIRQQ